MNRCRAEEHDQGNNGRGDKGIISVEFVSHFGGGLRERVDPGGSLYTENNVPPFLARRLGLLCTEHEGMYFYPFRAKIVNCWEENLVLSVLGK